MISGKKITVPSASEWGWKAKEARQIFGSAPRKCRYEIRL
jgi:hypothetical protein